MKNYCEAFANEKPGEQKISFPGTYRGFNPPVYDSYVRFSQYVTMTDGTRLAVTCYRPAMNGVPTQTPLPVIWRFTPYGRLQKIDGEIKNMACFGGDGGWRPGQKGQSRYVEGCEDPSIMTGADLMIREFTARGYVVAIADVRGKFASFGYRKSLNPAKEPQDAYEINEWLATQPWCNGKTGMYGSSYTGQTQLETIRMQPPHLKAAVVCMTDYNKFDGWIRGGISRGRDMVLNVPDNPDITVPVDEDPDGVLMRKAMKQHALNSSDLPLDESEPRVLPYYKYGRLPYRDSFCKVTDSRFWEATSASTYKDKINDSGVAMYLIGGWFDVFRRDTVIMYNNLTVPKKMIIGPWFHTVYKDEVNLLVEHLRFYDYWLKGIDNGIMNEPPIYAKTVNKEENSWNFYTQWPFPGTVQKRLFFSPEKSGSAPSVNDGALVTSQLEDESSSTEYLTRYDIEDREEIIYTTDLDAKSLTFTSAPLTEEVNVSGHPIAEVHFTSTGKDSDFFVFLLDVDEKGRSRVVSNGVLRASMRLTEEPPYYFNNLPWHPCRESDRQLPDFSRGPIQLDIDMHPTNYIFQAGHRIRVSVSCAVTSFLFYQEQPAPTIQLWHDSLRPSGITLPILK